MEGSEEVRREYARLSVGWRCRECGVGNLEGMKRVWEGCREKGVKVEIEGFEDGEVEVGTDGEGVERGEEGMGDGDGDGMAMVDVVEEDGGDGSVSVPAQVSAPVQAQAPSASTGRASAADMSARTGSAQLATESLSEGVWLDRAIVGVVVALVVLILRRVANVNEVLL
ncbi:uncharacterized protein N7515_009530 [Penicillium bovifimosum]|uniref:Uncharacterized protein n=1 Tax=Penicillium bovifimosum TaxID=126998 RepID=A0A9W9KVS5_9EURO|nr:uncharacterized protein N7515_009530 [Penicillium bovifimosum]KAJ5121569.1 hypothetical protein N7515_009530 [Penicillium bovifimosum]